MLNKKSNKPHQKDESWTEMKWKIDKQESNDGKQNPAGYDSTIISSQPSEMGCW